jgi:hypothetical protein
MSTVVQAFGFPPEDEKGTNHRIVLVLSKTLGHWIEFERIITHIVSRQHQKHLA